MTGDHAGTRPNACQSLIVGTRVPAYINPRRATSDATISKVQPLDVGVVEALRPYSAGEWSGKAEARTVNEVNNFSR
jgi:hypothetical protein